MLSLFNGLPFLINTQYCGHPKMGNCENQTTFTFLQPQKPRRGDMLIELDIIWEIKTLEG